MAEQLGSGLRLLPEAGPHFGRPNDLRFGLSGETGGGSEHEALINWQGSAFDTASGSKLGMQGDSWTRDFTNHLGKSKVEREPNAKISLVLPEVAAKVVSDAARRISALFR